MKLPGAGYEMPNYEQNTYEEIPGVSPQTYMQPAYHNENVMENPIKLQNLAEYIEENSQQQGTFKQKFVVSITPPACT